MRYDKSARLIRIFRTHLFVASLSAICIQLILFVPAAISNKSTGLQLPESFRLYAISLIVASVVWVKIVARRAFDRALANRDAVFYDGASPTVSVSKHCMRRRLVLLHVGLSGWSSEPVGRQTGGGRD
ncbi:hypothetical protein [Paraburkholderia acidipaludis]|uniref:hypothetical protein n=1 Tax=Paraburkholderia acidipaludis TaxID=660537 RepID=UPI0012EBB879|nr:hypothetical protein [Paraburkholderia acidipaludis]